MIETTYMMGILCVIFMFALILSDLHKIKKLLSDGEKNEV
jgi:hypothetical protein